MALCDRYFSENQVDMLFYEKGLSLGAAFEIGMQEETVALLRGAIGVVEACASKAKIPIIRGVSVQEARKHLVGRGQIPKGQGKSIVRERCRVLGWQVANDDESDACAIWSWGCGQANPLSSVHVTPLFGGV